MLSQDLSVVSIHDQNKAILTCDLKDVLRALQDYMDRWIWCVTEFDALGQGDTASQCVEKMCRMVECAGPSGVWLSSEEMTDLASKITQTTDGRLLAFHRLTPKEHISIEDLSFAAFPISSAELAIHIVDSTYLEIYSKSAAIPDRLRRNFRDVHEEDPRDYFGEL